MTNLRKEQSSSDYSINNSALENAERNGFKLICDLQEYYSVINWDQHDRFLQLVRDDAKPPAVYSVFPADKTKSCIHITGEGFDQRIESLLNRKTEHSLGLILGVAKEQPEDWGTKPEHINKAGYPRTWGASDAHIDYLNVLVVEGDPENMDPDQQVNCIHKAGFPPASFTVLSGNKSVHQYWKVKKCPASKWRNIQERLLKVLDARVPELKVDQAIKNTSRVMRCAGGRHSKTKDFCEIRSISDNIYSWEVLDEHISQLEKETFEHGCTVAVGQAHHKFGKQAAWLSSKTFEEKKEIVIDMLQFIPKHEGAGLGRRNTICIPTLAGLVNEFGNRTEQVIREAGWMSEKWDPINELQYVYDPIASLGTVVYHARNHGWVHPADKVPAAIDEVKKDIKIETIFPTELANDIKKITTYLPYKDSLMILSFMSAVAPLIKLGTKINCNPFSDFVLPLNLYGCVIGQSGAKKSPLMRLLIEDPLKGVKSDIAKENYHAGQQYVKDLADFNSNGGDKPERPAYPIIITKDATAESLEQQLMEQEKAKLGLLRLNDELAGYIKSFGAYKKGQGKDEEQHLELYDGGGFFTLRMEQNRYCEMTAYSIFGGAQPEVMKKLQQGQDHNGKWARFIFDYLEAKPTKLAITGTAAEKVKFNLAKDRLKEFLREVRAFRTNSLELSDEALSKFAEFEFSRQGLVSNKKIKPAHAAIYNKSAGKVGRIAGILHIIEQVQEKIKNKIVQGDSYVDLPPFAEVQLETINKAIDLINYWDELSNNIASKSSESSVDEIMKRLLSIAAKSKTPVPFSEIKKGLSFDHRKKYQTEEIYKFIEKLAELDLGETSTGPRAGKMFKALKPWPNS